MPLDRISSATPYAALALVQAATANAPRLETPRSTPLASTAAGAPAFTLDVKASGAEVNGEAITPGNRAPDALQAREDRLGQRFDARA
jgi:hypothetical protein